MATTSEVCKDVMFVFKLLGMTKFKSWLGSSDVMFVPNFMYIPTHERIIIRP
jgi:hypothetical protein